jgi:hypothetical protein
LLEHVGADGTDVQTLDSFVFSDELVIIVSEEVNKRNTLIMSIVNHDVQACGCKNCDRSNELRTWFRGEINHHHGLCTRTCWRTSWLHKWTTTRGPTCCSNKVAHRHFSFDMPATSLISIKLENLLAVTILFLGLEGHRT